MPVLQDEFEKITRPVCLKLAPKEVDKLLLYPFSKVLSEMWLADVHICQCKPFRGRCGHLPPTILKTTKLSRTNIDMKWIVNYVRQSQRIDTPEIIPRAQLAIKGNIFRDDKTRSSLSEKQALSHTPNKDDDYFRVPGVIG